jgi:prolyl oligopeptidase
LKNPGSLGWTELISEKSVTIESVVAIDDKFAVTYKVDGATEAYIYNMDGTLFKQVALPSLGSIGAWKKDLKRSQVVFTFSSMVTPVGLYALDVKTGKISITRHPITPFDSRKYEVVKESVKGRDGTKLTVLIARKKGSGQDGKEPLLLEGYGGFGVSLTSYFSSSIATWLEMGGTYAKALIRGGGEYGEAWRKDGMLLKKQNSFNDFVDIAQYLVDKKYTSSSRLGIIGESNGGLLVAAAVNQRPTLFGAAASLGGITDMMRLESYKTAFDWTDEYGTLENAADFRNMLSYSPVHNLSYREVYPSIYVGSSELDDRVLPWHQFKYTAALQNAKLGEKPKMMRVTYGAGHALGKSLQIQNDELVDYLTFMSKELGLIH